MDGRGACRRERRCFTLERDVLVAVVDGTVVGHGIGVLMQRDGVIVAETEGAVDPGYRRRGIGTALFHRSLARLRVAAEADPRPGPREVRAYALDEAVSERALLDAEGFVPIRFGYEMRRYLAGALPDHPLPAGLELRPVTPDAHRQVFDADDEAFEDHWGHRTPTEEDFHARFHGPDVDTSLWCVAWDGDEVAGVVVNADRHPRERRAWDPPRLARARLRPPPVAGARRGQGAVRVVLPGAARPGHGRGLAGRGRLEPDRSGPPVRGARVPRGPRLEGVRATDRRPGAARLAVGQPPADADDAER